MKISRLAGCLAVVAVAGFGVLRPAAATQADSGTITTTSTKVSYTHGPFFVPNATNNVNTNGLPTCGTGTPCDDYTVNVNVPAGTDTTQQIKVQVSWPLTTADFDLYVYDSHGNNIASSASSSDPEVTYIPAVTGSYIIRVVPFDPQGQSFTGTIDLENKPSANPGTSNVAPLYTGVAPRFQNYPVPHMQGGNAGEPSIGVDWKTGNAMYQAGLQTFRVHFDDTTSPAAATWSDVSSTTTSKTSLDAILFTDHLTNRTFVSQLTGQDSLSAFTDDDGGTYTPSQGGGIPSGVDHQSIGGGPYATGGTLPPPPNTTTYKDAVYYCSQDIAASFCARSDNGGLTFGAGVPIYTLNQCSGLHGHVKVAYDGTVYVPNKNCGGHTAVVVSTDNGLTWSVRPIPDSGAAIGGDPSVGIGSKGTIYVGYQNADGHALVAVSHDRGLHWSKSRDVGAQLGVQNIVFPEVTAGDDNRAAFAFIGTLTGGNYQATGTFPGVWYVYEATTYDGGSTWVTQNLTPNDPVQRGSICTNGTTCGSDRNLLDFMDITTDAHGHVLVAYPDGCVQDVNQCVTGTKNSFTAYAVIARQSGGHSLFSAYDTPQPSVPGRPRLFATRTSSTAPVRLDWFATDSGGSTITSYRVYRATGSNVEVYLGSTSKLYYIDSTAVPNTPYFYTVRAVNAVGTGPESPRVAPFISNPRPMCSIPGKLELTDPSGDQFGAPNNPDLDIQALNVAEPYSAGNDLVFTLKVASLATLPPNHQYRIFWDYPDGSGNRYYVGMNTDATGAPSYVYGTEFGQNTGVSGSPGVPTTTTPALAGSGYSTNGNITIVVPKSGVGNPAPTSTTYSTLKNLQARTYAGQANVTVLLTAAATDVTGYNNYTVVGNAYCK